jgi:DNA-binding SARP family transcriptional activator
LFALAPNADAFSYVGTVPVVRDVVLVEALAAGISIPLVQELIGKYEVVPTTLDLQCWPWPVKVYTLGEFRIEVDGQPAQFSRKTPRKALLLLKALIAMGGRSVPQRRLVDALWPDEDGSAGVEALGASLHRLRKLLVHANAIEFSEGLLSINCAKVWVDLWSLEQQTTLPERQFSQDEDAARIQRVFSLYRGPFLDDDLDAPWAITPRERARGRFLRYLLVTGNRLEAAGQFDAAATLFRTGVDTDDLAEDLYQGLMRALNASGHRAEALAIFRRLHQVLDATLGIKPSSRSLRLFEEIQQQH